ncbi:heme d1 biosynthesis protein NirF [Sulfuricella denitrificans skB26]|uniref:Heme d1 biosynthesis protein NirF n=1 Tax=Sulfuricella denitrificans (strain DSM 22764 / NBRC 105220 / skB26) TaxID=1163617 RepID=S6AEM5_SULDS|nr:cytochrome D1 domain-containing protein [Sulfuricella denitrificans]BAN34221.1 heme d1 biosynthesis protein NirF [Sulfuricella denitrificans skB26]
MSKLTVMPFFLLLMFLQGCASIPLRGTGDLGVVIERAVGSIQVVETTGRTRLGKIDGLGDLSHASVNYSRDERYAYIFGRDGGLTKVDLLEMRIVKRVMQSGNSIGGAISQDGKLVAVANYTPGGVKVFDAVTLELVANIPALDDNGKSSKVIGLVDAPGNRFVFSLFEAGEIWLADLRVPTKPALTKFKNVGKEPYDAMITADGRYYLAGLFGEDGLALLDLWDLKAGVKRVLDGYGKGEQKLPVYKMPHLEGWAATGNELLVPAVGRHEVLVIDQGSWKEVGRISVHGQPVFVVARPDNRQVWVNYAFPHNEVVQVIDVPSRTIVKTLQPGKGVLHMEFTPRGEQIWISVRDEDRVEIYDTETFEKVSELPVDKPSGIFFTPRAHRTGL